MPLQIYIFSITDIWSRDAALQRQCEALASRDCRLSTPTVATAVGHPRRAVDAGQWLWGSGWQGQSVVMGAAALWAWLAGYQVSFCRAAAPPAFLQQPAEVELLVQFPQVVLRGAKKITANAVMRYSGVYICKCAVCNNVKQYQYEKVVYYLIVRLCNFIILILCLNNFLYNLLFADNFVNIKLIKRSIFSGTA